MTDELTTEVRSKDADDRTVVDADVAILGAGISGVSAALEAARAGNEVVLVDARPAIGGQAVGAMIRAIIGCYTHEDEPRRLIHGIVDDIIDALEPEGAIERQWSPAQSTYVLGVDGQALGRWMERELEAAGVTSLVGAVLTDVGREGRRVTHLDLAHQFGPVRVHAPGFVDASGNASLCWEAGADTRVPTRPIYGTLHFLIEGHDTAAVDALDVDAVNETLEAKGDDYGLGRHDGILKRLPGKDVLHANVTHLETPLDPLASGEMVAEGRDLADAMMAFLRAEYPDAFAEASVRAYADPGIRQTRWIVGRRQLTVDDLRRGERFDDAVTRGAWWVELHEAEESVTWERFPEGHVYYVPLSCQLPADLDNVVATGRCIDADAHALAAVRVMGPGIAMGAAAAHAIDLADGAPLHAVDTDALQDRLAENLEGHREHPAFRDDL